MALLLDDEGVAMNAIDIRKVARENMDCKVTGNNRRHVNSEVSAVVMMAVSEKDVPMGAHQEGFFWVLSDYQNLEYNETAYGWTRKNT